MGDMQQIKSFIWGWSKQSQSFIWLSLDSGTHEAGMSTLRIYYHFRSPLGSRWRLSETFLATDEVRQGFLIPQLSTCSSPSRSSQRSSILKNAGYLIFLNCQPPCSLWLLNSGSKEYLTGFYTLLHWNLKFFCFSLVSVVDVWTWEKGYCLCKFPPVQGTLRQLISKFF